MSNIPFPNVPAYPGVPAIPRQASTTLAAIAIDIGTLQDLLGSSVQYAAQWGIYDQNGERLGIPSSSLLAQIAIQDGFAQDTVQSTSSFDFVKETTISDFPLEKGSFANFNKVERPANPVVVIAIDGTQHDRAFFIQAIDQACKSTDLYNVLTPEVVYLNYSLEAYKYQRRSDRGATLLVVEISLKEIRQVSASFTQVTPIVAPQRPAAESQVDNGKVQPAAPDVSTLKSIAKKLGIN